MHTDFKASTPVRFAFVLVFLAALLMPWAFRGQDGAIWLDILCAVGIVAVVFAWPRAIHLDHDRIRQRDRLGQVRSILWADVDSIAFAVADRKAIVGGGDVQIVHGPLHSDKEAFCKQIEQRTGRMTAHGLWPSE